MRYDNLKNIFIISYLFEDINDYIVYIYIYIYIYIYS
jgi:hypothetical protein